MLVFTPSVPEAVGRITVAPDPVIRPPSLSSDPETLTVAAPASVPPLSVRNLTLEGSSALETSRVPLWRIKVPVSITVAAFPPSVRVTVVPAPKHATSVAVGTTPVDQLLATCHTPSLPPLHVSVQRGSAAAVPGRPITISPEMQAAMTVSHLG